VTGSPPLPNALLEWAVRTSGGAPVDRWTIEKLAGGAVSDLVERITLYPKSAGGRDLELSVVRKRALPHEIAGLQAAQAVRPAATSIPELITWGRDETGPWMITVSCPGEPLAGWSALVPSSLFQSLARLHAHYQGATSELAAQIPRVDAAWWKELCLSWVLPRIAKNLTRVGTGPIARATALLTTVADHAAARGVLAGLKTTLLHGDVHPGNVIVSGEYAGLIDWGSARIGSAMLDLANLVRQDSDAFATYADTWLELTGRPLDNDQADLGYKWAALQIPVQYLPWTMGHSPSAGVDAALDAIEGALAALTTSPRRSLP
jgi:hypothetical protein